MDGIVVDTLSPLLAGLLAYAASSCATPSVRMVVAAMIGAYAAFGAGLPILACGGLVTAARDPSLCRADVGDWRRRLWALACWSAATAWAVYLAVRRVRHPKPVSGHS